MSVKKYHWFGNMTSTVKWLNKMADRGLRVSGVTVTGCEFEECEPGKYEYALEFVGHMSREKADEYARFLRECGYRTFFKNLAMDWNTGKVELRPWAEKGARLARNSTTYNRELLIVEKERDGRPFELHTSAEDRLWYAKKVAATWLWAFLVFTVCAVLTRRWAFLIPAVPSLLVVVIYFVRILRLRREGKISEK